MSNDVYSPDEFIQQWARTLGVPAEPYTIAVRMINVNHNYDTAMSLIFGLSWLRNTQYLRRVVDYFKANFPENGVATAEWLAQFVQHYVSEVEAYPE